MFLFYDFFLSAVEVDAGGGGDSGEDAALQIGPAGVGGGDVGGRWIDGGGVEVDGPGGRALDIRAVGLDGGLA